MDWIYKRNLIYKILIISTVRVDVLDYFESARKKFILFLSSPFYSPILDIPSLKFPAKSIQIFLILCVFWNSHFFLFKSNCKTIPFLEKHTNLWLHNTEEHSRTSQTSQMKFFAIIVHSFQVLTISEKVHFDVWLCSQYVSALGWDESILI